MADTMRATLLARTEALPHWPAVPGLAHARAALVLDLRPPAGRARLDAYCQAVQGSSQPAPQWQTTRGPCRASHVRPLACTEQKFAALRVAYLPIDFECSA